MGASDVGDVAVVGQTTDHDVLAFGNLICIGNGVFHIASQLVQLRFRSVGVGDDQRHFHDDRVRADAVEKKAKKIAELLKLLANEHRLLILCDLMSGPLTVGEIYAFPPNITASALSQRLNQLKTAGILASEKLGINVVYRILGERAVALIGTIYALLSCCSRTKIHL